MAAFRGSRNAAGFGNSDKVLEIAKVKVQGVFRRSAQRRLNRTSRARVDAYDR